MTSSEVQSILTTIFNHINGKSGSIISISISNGEALVLLDWPAFISNFSGQNAEKDDSVNPIWRKTVGLITYEAKQPQSSGTQTVPGS